MAYVDYGQGILQASSQIADALKAVNAMKFDLLVQKARMDYDRQQRQEQRTYETEMVEREWAPETGYRAIQAAQESKLKREEAKQGLMLEDLMLQEKAGLEREQKEREFGYEKELREMPIKYEYPGRESSVGTTDITPKITELRTLRENDKTELQRLLYTSEGYERDLTEDEKTRVTALRKRIKYFEDMLGLSTGYEGENPEMPMPETPQTETGKTTAEEWFLRKY